MAEGRPQRGPQGSSSKASSVSIGDPAFGRSFETVRSELVREWVYQRRNEWVCKSCGARWNGLADRYSKVLHAKGCALRLGLSDEEPAFPRELPSPSPAASA
jgi:hypothetical protein